MSNDFLELNYYFDQNGEREKLVNVLSDCETQCAYLLIKNKYKYDINNYYDIFLEDISFNIREKNDVLEEFTVAMRIKEIFSLINNDKVGIDGYFELEKLLDRDEMVIVATVSQWMPFSKFYDKSFVPDNYKEGHAFLIIGHDEKNFYYVENPDLLNNGGFTKYENNQEIGVLPKEILKEASKHCCICKTIEIDFKAIDNCSKISEKALCNSISNFYKENIKNGKENSYYGRGALERLKEYCIKENLRLDDDAPTKDRNLYTYFDWKIWSIKNRRNILKGFIENEGNFPLNNELINALNKTVEEWESLFRILGKNHFTERNIFDSKYVKNIDNLIELEEGVVKLIRQFISERYAA